ncbi:DHHC palmitoyltransferase-domain-containing protein [Dunaliella salina]|uniref:S-acyltransferase n=1 Tax=Dunaliella salina TaxID=3046 RepID=A0ABQ7H596_DUNSA|nr:DHHC palmitoyltransferase-domain-containing protein [Dunaliella salina]|eukprot:KAF5842027.1 DHHC palmitoyltransferase-domain-containing protein [Dunaliella salina]
MPACLAARLFRPNAACKGMGTGTSAGFTPQQQQQQQFKWLSCSKWLNCFQYCSRCLSMLGHVMVLLVLSMVALTYCAVVFVSYGPLMFSSSKLKVAGGLVVVVVFTLMIVLVLWTYFAAVLTDPGRVPPDWHPFLDEQHARLELDRMSYSDYYFDRRDPRRPRYCKRCQAWKPERAHHCSVLGRCVLRMDHYCIWLVNCVGLMNYKFFLLFMLYTCLTCITATLLLVPAFIDFFKDRLQGARHVAWTRTPTDHAHKTISDIQLAQKGGLRKNFEEVFGHNKLRWLLPVHSQEEKRALADSCFSTCLLSPVASASA